MNMPIDPGLRLELRDAASGTVAVFVSQEVVAEVTAERDRLCQELARQQAELATLREAKQAVEKERDDYLGWLKNLAEKYFGMTEEVLANLTSGNGVPAAEVLAEIEQIIYVDVGKDPHG